jgi:hypothetical protein
MIKLNISNLIPRRLAIYLLGIIPGVLFHLSAAFADDQRWMRNSAILQEPCAGNRRTAGELPKTPFQGTRRQCRTATCPTSRQLVQVDKFRLADNPGVIQSWSEL